MKAKVWFDIELALACPASDAGSRLRISVGTASFETIIPAAPAPEIPLLHLDEKSRYRNRQWFSLNAGTLKRPKGPAKLTIEPLTMRETQVMDFKHVKLNIISAP